MPKFPKPAAITLLIATSLVPYAQGAAQDVYGPSLPAEMQGVDTLEQPEPVPAPRGVPMALVQAVEIASRDHPIVGRALSERRASQAELRGARWQRFPSLSVEALAITQGNQNTADQNGIAANVVVEQPLWTAGRITGTIAGARAALEANSHAVADAQAEIALRTVSAYFDLALATRREEILMDSLGQHQELLQTITRRVDQEVSPRADLELAGSRAAQIEQDLAAVAGLRQTSYSQLRELIGYADLDLGSVPVFDAGLVLPSEEELVASALECSPRLKALRALQSEVDAQRRVARSRLFPQVVAQASHNEITGTRFGVTLRVQTGNGLSQLSAIEVADAQVLTAEYEVASAERDIREQIRNDFLTYEAGRNRAFASERATRSSQEVTESYQRQFITGRRTWLDVMNAVRESMSARLTEAEAQLGAMAAFSRLSIRSCLWRPAPPRHEQEN